MSYLGDNNDRCRIDLELFGEGGSIGLLIGLVAEKNTGIVNQKVETRRTENFVDLSSKLLKKVMCFCNFWQTINTSGSRFL